MNFGNYALTALLLICTSPASALDPAGSEGDGSSGQVVATIDSKYGSIVFVEETYEDETRIGMLTTGSISLSSLMDQNATALEVFMLFRDEKDVIPERLFEDHYLAVDRKPIDYSEVLGLAAMRNKQEFYYISLYRNLSKDSDLCNDLVADFAGPYGIRPSAVWQENFVVPPSEYALVGLANGSYNYNVSWNTYANDVAYVDPPLAFQVTLDAVNEHSSTGDSQVWSAWGYKRDIAVCVNTWRIMPGYYSEEGEKYNHGMESEIPWDEYDLKPCDNGQCSFGKEIFGFCYSEETDDEPLHNHIDFRVRILGQKEGGEPWLGPSVNLKWIGEGARYYSTFFGDRRRYKIEVTDLSGNEESKLCKASYLIYMLSNGNWNANSYTRH